MTKYAIFQKLEWYDVDKVVENFRSGEYLKVLIDISKDDKDMLEEATRIDLDLLPQLLWNEHITKEEYLFWVYQVQMQRIKLSFYE